MADGSYASSRSSARRDAERAAEEIARQSQTICDIDAASSILKCYMKTLRDEQAEDRYVLWAVLEKLDVVRDAVEGVPKAQ
jgi:hypothetical protein